MKFSYFCQSFCMYAYIEWPDDSCGWNATVQEVMIVHGLGCIFMSFWSFFKCRYFYIKFKSLILVSLVMTWSSCFATPTDYIKMCSLCMQVLQLAMHLYGCTKLSVLTTVSLSHWLVYSMMPVRPHGEWFYLRQLLMVYFVFSRYFSALMLLVGWQEGHPACKKLEWCGAGVVICLEQGADLCTAQRVVPH